MHINQSGNKFEVTYQPHTAVPDNLQKAGRFLYFFGGLAFDRKVAIYKDQIEIKKYHPIVRLLAGLAALVLTPMTIIGYVLLSNSESQKKAGLLALETFFKTKEDKMSHYQMLPDFQAVKLIPADLTDKKTSVTEKALIEVVETDKKAIELLLTTPRKRTPIKKRTPAKTPRSIKKTAKTPLKEKQSPIPLTKAQLLQQSITSKLGSLRVVGLPDDEKPKKVTFKAEGILGIIAENPKFKELSFDSDSDCSDSDSDWGYTPEKITLTPRKHWLSDTLKVEDNIEEDDFDLEDMDEGSPTKLKGFIPHIKYTSPKKIQDADEIDEGDFDMEDITEGSPKAERVGFIPHHTFATVQPPEAIGRMTSGPSNLPSKAAANTMLYNDVAYKMANRRSKIEGIASDEEDDWDDWDAVSDIE